MKCSGKSGAERDAPFQTHVLRAPRFQYGTRQNENVLADFGFLKEPML